MGYQKVHSRRASDFKKELKDWIQERYELNQVSFSQNYWFERGRQLLCWLINTHGDLIENWWAHVYIQNKIESSRKIASAVNYWVIFPGNLYEF